MANEMAQGDGKYVLIAAVVNALIAAMTSGAITPSQAQASAEAIQADATHHKMIDEAYARMIAAAEDLNQ